ncbi:hypothetical protein BH09PLA1_BH09PLA1_10700 [soil metagenome]
MSDARSARRCNLLSNNNRYGLDQRNLMQALPDVRHLNPFDPSIGNLKIVFEVRINREKQCAKPAMDRFVAGSLTFAFKPFAALLGRFRFGGILPRLGGVHRGDHLGAGTLEFLVRKLALLVHLTQVGKRESFTVKVFIRMQTLARPDHSDK